MIMAIRCSRYLARHSREVKAACSKHSMQQGLMLQSFARHNVGPEILVSC